MKLAFLIIGAVTWFPLACGVVGFLCEENWKYAFKAYFYAQILYLLAVGGIIVTGALLNYNQ